MSEPQEPSADPTPPAETASDDAKATDAGGPVPRGRRVARRLLLAGLTLALGLLAYARFIEPQWIELTEHVVGEPVEGGATIRVVHLTDLHLQTLGSRERKLLAMIEPLRPDLIVITGDSVGPGHDPDALTAFLDALEAKHGVWACAGNWDEWTGGKAYDSYEAAGVRLLRDAAVELLDGRLVLAGADSPQPPNDARADGPAFHLLLCHYPAVLDWAARAGFDLVLAGHTHGGQVRLPGLGPAWLPFDSDGLDAGWFERDRTRLYVSRGIGTSIMPVRLFCRPELAVFEVHLPPAPPRPDSR